MDELLALLAKNSVTMTGGHDDDGLLFCSLQKRECHCSFKFDETLSMKKYIEYFFVPAIAELHRRCDYVGGP